MTKTLAIFGVVSVLTAAIVGGVFIRKKIIDDALYWKAWSEAQTRWKREIRGLEEDVSALTLNLKAKSKSKENTEKEIERCKRDIEEAVKDISKHEEQMESFRNFNITKTMFEKITNNLNRQTSLKKIIEVFTLKITNQDFDIFYEGDDSNNKIETKIKNFKDNLATQKEKLQKHAVRRILWHGKFKEHFIKKEEKIKLKNQFEKSLQDSQSSLSLLESLIEELMEKLNEKTKSLSSLREQGPVVII